MISQTKNWFKNAIIQEIYPLTFNAPDGKYGTLRGGIDRLGYVKDLGADAIWFTPFYQSPLQNGLGYNITSYTDICPTMGTPKDRDDLIEAVHDHDMAVILDMVFGHTSYEHPWFQASERAGKIVLEQLGWSHYGSMRR